MVQVVCHLFWNFGGRSHLERYTGGMWESRELLQQGVPRISDTGGNLSILKFSVRQHKSIQVLNI